MTGRTWNPELLGPQWSTVTGLSLGGAWVGGEAALAGYWLQHRVSQRMEVHALGEAFDRVLEQLPGPETLFPGYVRASGLELVREEQPPLEPPTDDPFPAASLLDLAVDRWLRCFGSEASSLWLVDLYFLERARVDLERAAQAMVTRDLAATRRALAVILHETRVEELPKGLVRPVSLAQLEDFRRRWTDQLALETFS